MAKPAGYQSPNRRKGWRGLGLFWLTALSLMGIGAGGVQLLGPGISAVPLASSPLVASPVTAAVVAPKPIAAAPSEAGHHQVTAVAAKPALSPRVGAGRDEPGPVSDPDPSLLELVSVDTAGGTIDVHLPRIAEDGRAPMRTYAAGFDPSSRRPRVAVLLAGIGLNEAESLAAIRTLPGGISLAVSPYAATKGAGLPRLLANARAAGHEYLMEIPLEPSGFPLNDPGPSSLMTSLPEAGNLRNLRTVLSRFEGYAGAAGVSGTMRGERLAGMTDQMDLMLSELAARGLMYIDPLTSRDSVAKTWGRHADLVIDDPPERAAIDAKLAELEQQAKDTGAALGVALRPAPVTVARIAAWSSGLLDRGLALAPASALAQPPVDESIKVSERAR